MSIKPTRRIKDLNKNSKNRLRMYKAVMIGKPKNYRLKKLIDLLGYSDENAFFKNVKKQYNQELSNNTREKRSRSKYLYRLKQDIKTKKEFIKKGIDDEKFIMILNEIQKSKKKYLLSWDGKFYALSERKIKDLKERYKKEGSFFVKPNETFGSDEQLIYGIKNNRLKFKLVKGWAKYQQDEGEFFNMINKTPFDLSEFQIFNEVKAENYEKSDICLIHSLKLGGLSEEKLKQIRGFIKVRSVPKNKIREICELINIKIKIKVFSPDIVKHNLTFGTNDEELFNIGLINNHYFLIKPLNITKYALMNCFNEEFKKNKDWEELILEGTRYRKQKRALLDSFELIKLLYINKDLFLEDIQLNEEIYKTIYHQEFNNIDNLEYLAETVRENEYKPIEQKTEDEIFKNVFFDFETTTDGEKHKPYIARIAGDKKLFTFEEEFKKGNKGDMITSGGLGGYRMLYYIAKKYNFKNIRLIAHNAAYDIRFIFNFIKWDNIIERGNALLRAYGKFYYQKGKFIKIEVQCSRAFLNCKLKDFSKMFKLDIKKEVMPYGLYNSKILNNPKNWEGVNIDKILKYCIKENVCFKEFLENAKEWGCLKDDNKIDIIKYSSYYCEADCELLKKGWETFKEWIEDGTGLNINHYISISSLVDSYFKKEGVYDGVYEVSGHVREFIQRAMIGGRTMTRKNKKRYFKQESKKEYIKENLNKFLKKEIKGFNLDNKIEGLKRLVDFDAVSLYPSSQFRLGGYLMGKPKILKDLNYDNIKTFDGYFIEIEILKVNKKLDFPLMSYINSEGVRIFSNRMKNKRIYVDKATLEDLIKYQKIKFNIIKGYYYNEGRNMKLKEVIEKLFNKRKELKKAKNPAQVIYKLMMNASYGKTLLKPFETETKILNFKAVKPFIERNYNIIKSIDILSDKKWEELADFDLLKVKVEKPINKHFNNSPAGVEVLSMSKRIMNEVICTAEDMNIKIYYQDTDSLHIEEGDIKKLESKYIKEFKKPLIGSSFGQFHSDFESDFLKEGSIFAVESIFLGKKCYIDKLWDNQTLNDKGAPKYDYHIRMKGMNRAGILHGAEKIFNGDIMKLYKALLAGNKIKLDLAAGGSVPCFDFEKNNNISTKKEFLRDIEFKESYKINLNKYEGKI